MSEGDRQPLSREQLRERRARARARRAKARRRGAALLTTAVIALAAGLWTGLASGGRHGARGGSTRGGTTSATNPLKHPVTFTVEASGDLLIHSPVWDAALAAGGGTQYDFAALFTQVKPIIDSADLPLCHVETPMTPAPPSGFPIFNTPPELARAIHQIGFKACSTAATHSLDQGDGGVRDTIQALDHAGVLHTGTFVSAAAQRRPLIIDVKGVRVAFLAYTDITNGIPSPHPWSVNRANAPQILADARRAHRDGAQVVIVNIHWGDEYVSTPAPFQLQLARQLTASPYITAVVGQHVHVAQPIERINGKLVVFGEGNLISNQTSACCLTATQDGMIALLTIRADAIGAKVTFIHYVPIWVRHPGFHVLPAGLAIAGDPADADLLRASYERTVGLVGRMPDVQPVPAQLP